MAEETARSFVRLSFYILLVLKCIHATSTSDDLCEGKTKCSCVNFIMDCRSQKLTEFPKKIHEDIKAIYLDGNLLENIGQLPEEAELQTLSMPNNQIKNLTYDAFDNLDNLKTLILSNNNISTIADDIFEWNPLNLEVLHLDGNQMEFIQHFLFYDLEKLTELYLQNNKITFVHPHAFLQLKNLRRLRLDGNRLHTFNHKWVEKLQSSGLSELRFDENPWSCDCAMEEPQKWLAQEKKSKWFIDLTTDHPIRCKTPEKHKDQLVTSVTLDKLKTICDKPVITGISSSANISTGRDVLLRCVVDPSKFPWATLSWTAPNGDVYRLNTADNFEGIEVHQNGDLLIKKLKKSDEGNYTCTATNKAGSFSANTKIRVKEVPQPKPGPTKAPYTAAAEKPVESEKKDAIKFCPKVCQCVSRHIDCAGDGSNRQTALPENIPADAVTISFATNGLKSLGPKAFATFSQLEEIRFDNNFIETIDQAAFEGLTKLSTLTLRDNRIRNIAKGTFKNMDKLKVLVLDKNQLTMLDDEIFKGLESVQWLYLRDNLIKIISDNAFTPLKSIKFIHLENNAIQVIYPPSIQALTTMATTKIQKVFVDENPFHCDCNMEELREFVQSEATQKNFPDLFADGVICSFPAKMSDKELIDIKQTLVCPKEMNNPDNSQVASSYSGLLFGGIALGIILTIVLFILWRKYGRRVRCYYSLFRRTGGKSYNYSNLNGIDDGERSALTGDTLGGSGTEAFV